jgi:hypothetical protein
MSERKHARMDPAGGEKARRLQARRAEALARLRCDEDDDGFSRNVERSGEAKDVVRNSVRWTSMYGDVEMRLPGGTAAASVIVKLCDGRCTPELAAVLKARRFRLRRNALGQPFAVDDRTGRPLHEILRGRGATFANGDTTDCRPSNLIPQHGHSRPADEERTKKEGRRPVGATGVRGLCRDESQRRYVATSRTAEGKRRRAYFPDSVHGGTEAGSRAAAISHLASSSRRSSETAGGARERRSVGATGVPGLCRDESRRRYVATWTDPATGARMRARFPDSAHGGSEAGSRDAAVFHLRTVARREPSSS